LVRYGWPSLLLAAATLAVNAAAVSLRFEV
jgi:hypothetical protein